MLIDTHAHISCPQMDGVRNEVLNDLNENSVGLIVCPSYDVQTCLSTLQLVDNNEKVFGALGIHPSDERCFNDEIQNFINKNANNSKIVAIGEIGLDYHYENARPKNQEEVMLIQMEIAKKNNLPVIFHVRDAFDDFFNILKRNNNLIGNGVIHCFSGGVKEAEQALDLGFMISLTGSITYKNDISTQDAVKYIPLSRIMLETDSPYLAPVPHRGKICVPKYVELVCQKVAKLKNIDYKEVEEQTTNNALSFFTKMGGQMEEINQILKQNSFKFKHSFGQNFITDINLLNAIVKDANVLRTDNVLEIGTGAGTLTKQLSEATDKKVITVEIDKTLEPVLKQNLSECKNVEIKFGDILKFKPSELRQWFNNEPFKVVANLPYYISSPIIFYLLENNFNIQSLTIMLQYELATRLVAKPNSAQYGSVTVLLDLISNVKLIRKVPRTVFTPQPKVDSAVVRIDVDKNKWQVDDKCLNFIKNSFAMKRKTLQNNLSKSYGVEKDKIVQVLALSEIEPLARAENLSTEQFVKLYNNFSKLLKIN